MSWTAQAGRPSNDACHSAINLWKTRHDIPMSRLAGSGALGPRKRSCHHHSLCRAYALLPVETSVTSDALDSAAPLGLARACMLRQGTSVQAEFYRE
jgi:hypothetical protein